MKHFGVHLIFDGYGCPLTKLNQPGLIKKTLATIAQDLDMRTLHRPVVVRAPGNLHKDPGGYSGFLVIAESHVSLHTFDKRGFVSADIYSCKEFNAQKALADLKKTFQTKKVESRIILRGKSYPAQNIY